MITDVLRRNVTDAWGADGERWLTELPEILRELTRDWDVEVSAPGVSGAPGTSGASGASFDLTYHYVTAAMCSDGTPAVLKLGVPGGGSIESEARALATFDGHGMVRLLRADVARGALLLERVAPGARLRDLVPHDDQAATAAAAQVMRRLHVPVPADCALPRVDTRAEDFDLYLNRLGRYESLAPMPPAMVERASGLMRELCADSVDPVLLHGDLHHDNILSAEREPWLAIDPAGLVGDPAADVGALLYNPELDRREAALTALALPRAEQLADVLGLPLDRVIAWGFVTAVLSEVWTAEAWHSPADPIEHSRAIDVARLLEPRLG